MGGKGHSLCTLGLDPCESLASLLLLWGVPVDLCVFPGASHSWDGKERRLDVKQYGNLLVEVLLLAMR